MQMPTGGGELSLKFHFLRCAGGCWFRSTNVVGSIGSLESTIDEAQNPPDGG